jgi:hypothetical protein
MKRILVKTFSLLRFPTFIYLFIYSPDLSWRITDEFATAIIHQFIKDGTDAALLKPLFDIQNFMDKQHKDHPDKVYDEEEKAAETFVATHQHEKIVDFFAMSAKDGSYGDAGEGEDKSYDGYLKSHPELLQKALRGEPDPLAKVPSMLRAEILENSEHK